MLCGSSGQHPSKSGLISIYVILCYCAMCAGREDTASKRTTGQFIKRSQGYKWSQENSIFFSAS